jgi:hypothetical protein
MKTSDRPRWGRTTGQLTGAEVMVIRSLARGVEPRLRHYQAALDLRSMGLLRCVLGSGEAAFVLTDEGREWIEKHPEDDQP